MCDDYPMAYDILWALSFNQDIQKQLQAKPAFIAKIAHLAKESDNEQMRKITHGILWNLDGVHQERFTIDTNDQTTFDVMISYSHKDNDMCKQIYEQLIQSGYRVWIDFDQMHGNVMDAMAQAIERSQIILICMSEQYRRSNYCRAEAQYGFQRGRKLMPILLQKHYKPDGWLLFLIGQLLYIDFSKYEFNRAMDMLLKEMRIRLKQDLGITAKVESQSSKLRSISVNSTGASGTRSENMLDWSVAQVQAWLASHGLTQMCNLLQGCDGRSVVYLHRHLRHCRTNEVLQLLDSDSRRRISERLSILELCRFQSLVDQEKQAIKK